MNYYVSSEDDLEYTQVPASLPSLLPGLTPPSLYMCGNGASPLLVGNLFSVQLLELSENIASPSDLGRQKLNSFG